MMEAFPQQRKIIATGNSKTPKSRWPKKDNQSGSGGLPLLTVSLSLKGSFHWKVEGGFKGMSQCGF